jgi:hypothetical protein
VGNGPRDVNGKDMMEGISREEREGMEELARYGGVECRKDCAAVVVRVPVGREGVKDGKDGTGVVEEKTLRRLGFEVLEMVRGGLVKGSPPGPGALGAFGRA